MSTKIESVKSDFPKGIKNDPKNIEDFIKSIPSKMTIETPTKWEGAELKLEKMKTKTTKALKKICECTKDQYDGKEKADKSILNIVKRHV